MPDTTAFDWVSGNGNWQAIDRASFRLKGDDSLTPFAAEVGYGSLGVGGRRS